MRKIFSIVSLILLYTTIVLGQAAVNITITVSDNAPVPNSKVLNYGLDLTATNGIDPTLGESDLPPFPPAGVYEARFDLTPYAGSALSTYKDYRGVTSFPFSGQRLHRLIWQLGEGANALSIAYNMPGFATMLIQDELTGTIINSGNLTGSGTFPITFAVTALKLTITYTNATPVELTSFTGVQNGVTVQLGWITATEINNRGFEVERRYENSVWETLSFIEGNGTTTEIKSYSYTDDFSKNTVNGPVFYRLKQIDFDGTVNYSDEIQVDVDFSPSEFVLFQNYPNPFNPSTGIRYSVPFTSNVKIVVYNTLGEVMSEILNQVQEAGYYNLTWNASNLSSGTYFYSLEASSVDGKSSYSSIKKMMLLK